MSENILADCKGAFLKVKIWSFVFFLLVINSHNFQILVTIFITFSIFHLRHVMKDSMGSLLYMKQQNILCTLIMWRKAFNLLEGFRSMSYWAFIMFVQIQPMSHEESKLLIPSPVLQAVLLDIQVGNFPLKINRPKLSSSSFLVKTYKLLWKLWQKQEHPL